MKCALFGWLQTAVEVAAVQVRLLEKVRDLLNRLLTSAEDDGPAFFARRLFQQTQYFAALGVCRHGVHLVEILGPEVVAPLRQTVRLVEDPGGDLAVTERLDKG
ncbi:hypothetical protein [uncultured Thiocystis sp.]|jgi:hypothetical protein|uniref:hypothetical protein n=1 Tax=uncultured Thiocystis sp. TaxID=1202134 RepID=UPI0025F477E0|nr:hypothetical protein [uncultured Thiocystis sp.]